MMKSRTTRRSLLIAGAAALALVQARSELLLAHLQLGALAGALDDAQLDGVNAALQR